MLLRHPHDLAGLFRDGRARAGWSQTEFAVRVGVSRQWISMVENGKTSVEFDLVVGALQALEYHLHVDSSGAPPSRSDYWQHLQTPVHSPSQRTPLTRHGEPIGRQRSRRRPRGGGKEDLRGELRTLVNGELVANVIQRADGDLVLTYDRSWQERADAVPVSLSMPLSRREHGDAAVRPFMEGLLPDNAAILERWARQFHVSPRSPFALLSHMGEDCAGAVQFVRPDRYEDVTGAGEDDVEWLSEEDVAERLRDLVDQQGTGRLPGDRGHFSLAGAQPKMPLLFDGGRWGIPSGRTPTTHILKPPAQKDLDGFDVNEHFCLRLGKELGLAVAESTLRRFGDQEALVVARYDRVRVAGGGVVRLHQEDTCQALAVSPLRKHQNEGGPGPEDIVALLLRESDDPETDVAAFLDALALNWVIGGTDAHGKNYSLLMTPGTVRLAPFYDLISILPYPHRVHHRKAALAMRIDREYRLWKIRRRHWEGLAARCDLDPEPLVERIGQLVAAMPAAVEHAAAGLREEGVGDERMDRVAGEVREHSAQCLRALQLT